MHWFIMAALIALIDLTIKKYVQDHWKLHCSIPVAKGKIIFTKYYNTGAMLGLLKNKTKLLLGGTLLILGIIIGFLMSVSGRKGNLFIKAGLALLLGGAASNAFERCISGHVTDYFRINIGNEKFRRIVFNIGDFCIFAGALLFFACQMFQD